ncbi:hypothetical protein Tco_0555510 [Tanacetum coccineum]
MSDSNESMVIYTEVSSPFEGLSDIGSPGVVGPEHEGLPWMLDDPYMQGTEVFPAKEQPLPAAASPTAQIHQIMFRKEMTAMIEDDGNLMNIRKNDVDIEAEDEEDDHPLLLDSTSVGLPSCRSCPICGGDRAVRD